MPDEKFETNLLRMIAGEMYSSLLLKAAHDLFGRPYFHLADHEKNVVRQSVQALVVEQISWITPDTFPPKPSPFPPSEVN